tara:strand:+ start:16204 stop:16623 length:420 start_codon:yes stop_codon:yes gene_type:complete
MSESPKSTWGEYALQIAAVASLRSEDPHRKVGACALNHQNMVVGVGYNGLASGKNVDQQFWLDREARRKYMIHAEANCLSLCNKGDVKLLAVTLLPCSYCATMIAAYGVKEVYYNDLYERDDSAFEILDFYNVSLTRIY